MMFWWTIQRWWAIRYKLRLLIHRRKPFEGPIAEPMAAAMLHIRPMLADNVTMNNPLLERLKSKDNG